MTNLFSNSIKSFSDDSIFKFNFLGQDKQAVFEIQDWQIGIFQEDILYLLESFCHTMNGVNILHTGLKMAILKKCINIYKIKRFMTNTVIVVINIAVWCS
ncbi:MAG: hypothetical protein V7L12_23685 [Nostoc sp.]